MFHGFLRSSKCISCLCTEFLTADLSFTVNAMLVIVNTCGKSVSSVISLPAEKCADVKNAATAL